MWRRGNLLLIAAREPVAGFTKTRLGRAIGMDRAASLYRAFLADLAARFGPAALAGAGEPDALSGDPDAFDLAWAYTPSGCDFAAVLAALAQPVPDAANGAIRFVRQHGQDWGVGQLNLLRWGHMAGYERTVLVASDSPQLPVAMVRMGFAALKSHDVAIGSTIDGGYYLIGLRGFHDVLTGVPMSSSGAAEALVARARELGLRVAELAPTFDVDEEADLEMLYKHLASNVAAAPATWKALHELGLIPADGSPALEVPGLPDEALPGL